MIHQFKLATRLAKDARKEEKVAREPNRKKAALNRQIDLPVSMEIMDMMRNTFEFTDVESVREDVASILTTPMDSMSTLCPTASLLTSETAAARIPYGREEFTGTTTEALTQDKTGLLRGAGVLSPEDFSLTFPTSPGESLKASITRGVEQTGPIPYEEGGEYVKPNAFTKTKERFQVLWLQRRAQIEKESGNQEAAVKTLDEALNLHLGEGISYDDANLGSPVETRGPQELLVEMEEQFLPFDKTPHLAAVKLQSAYAKFHRFRTSAATFLQKHYRGRLGKKRYLRTLNLLTHCASMIQILFKHHLYHRIHPLATKLKNWYFMRVQMRDYQQQMLKYRRARRIQRLFRGNKGRARFKYVNDKLQGSRITQRNWRAGNYVRGQRLYGIQLIHKLFFQSAKKIQHRYRYLLSIKKAQERLITMLVAEEERHKEEKAIYEETIQVEIARNKFYMRTSAGKLHVADARRYIRLKDEKFNDTKDSLELEDIMAHKAMVTFECFDADGSGQIDAKELGLMLRELSIPMAQDDVVKLANEIDDSGDGEIDFHEFLGWYTGGGDGDKESGVGDALFRQMLKARHFVMEMTGQILTKRSEREILRQLTSYLAHDTIAAFRLRHPPKYQCCQCTRPFALFTDYISHFNGDGCCIHTNEKALFFPDYWDHGDWVNQRAVEEEVMRVHDEYPYVSFKASKAVFADLALMSDHGVQILMEHHYQSATDMFVEKLEDPQNRLKLSQFVIAVVDIAGEGVLPPHVAKRIADLIGATLPSEWITDDEWDLGAFEKWLQVHLDDVSKKTRERAGMLKMCISEKMLLRHDAYIVAKLYVNTLRQIQAFTEASLVGLMEFRKRRPRTIRLSDIILNQIGREDLTSVTYYETKNIILKRLKTVQAAMRHLVTLSLNRPSFWKKMWTKAQLLFLIPGVCKPPDMALKYAAIGPGEEISDEDMAKLMVAEAHIRAEAKQQARLNSRVGRSYIRRLSNELWAREFNMKSKLGNGSLSKWQAYRLGRDLYLFNVYGAKYGGEMCVDLPDMDELLMMKSISIKDQFQVDYMDELFPEKVRRVTYKKFTEWYKAKGWKQHRSAYRILRNAALICVNRLLFRSYAHDARMRAYMNARKVARLDLEISSKSIGMLVDVNTEETSEQQQEKAKVTEAAQLTKKAQQAMDASERQHKRSRVDVASQRKVLETVEEEHTSRLGFAESSASDFEEACRNRDQAKGATPDEKKEFEKLAKLARTEATKAKKNFEKFVPVLEEAKDTLELADVKEKANAEAYEKDMKTFEKAEKAEQVIRFEIESAHAKQAEEQAVIVEAMEADVADLSLQLLQANNEEIRGEERLLFRLSEDDAESECWTNVIRKAGRYQLATERLLMGMSIETIEAFGYLVPRGATSPTWVRFRKRLTKLMKSLSILAPLKDANGDEEDAEGEDMLAPLKPSAIVSPSAVTVNVHRKDLNPASHARGWDLAMGVLVHTFDTDCSGTFDEGEVRLLLQCINCGLSERRLLANFPEVMGDGSNLEKVVEYTAKRVTWHRGYLGPLGSSGALRIGMRGRTLASLMMLVSLSRQRAREFAEEAASLKNVIMGVEPVEEEECQDSAATITRAQLLAMRQIKMYLKTTHATVQRKAECTQVKHWWKLDVKALAGSKEGLIRYAFQLHREWKGLLVTELPHVVKYLVTRFGLVTTKDIDGAARVMAMVHGVDDLIWFSMNDALDLLMPMFEVLPTNCIAAMWWRLRHVRKNIWKDTKVNMYARARQQAVLTALNYPNLRVAATNYRCCSLGLAIVDRANKAKSWWTRRREKRRQRTKGISVNFKEVPREAMATLLLSRGFLMEDMTKPLIYDVVNVGRGDGELAMDTVDVGVVVRTARAGALLMTRRERAVRWLKFFSGTGIRRYFEYGMLVRTLALNEAEVRQQGAIFLKELLSGVSHCVAEKKE